MIAVDTNVLIRLLINDSNAQAQVDLAKNLLKTNKHVFVPQIVQIESVWVLETSYDFDKPSVIKVLNHLQKTEAFVLQHALEFATALEYFKKYNADFSDYLIFSECSEKDYQLFTFDKKLAGLSKKGILNIKLLA